jgi:hypothetical protein
METDHDQINSYFPHHYFRYAYRDYNSALDHLQNGLQITATGGTPTSHACGDFTGVDEAGSHD